MHTRQSTKLFTSLIKIISFVSLRLHTTNDWMQIFLVQTPTQPHNLRHERRVWGVEKFDDGLERDRREWHRQRETLPYFQIIRIKYIMIILPAREPAVSQLAKRTGTLWVQWRTSRRAPRYQIGHGKSISSLHTHLVGTRPWSSTEYTTGTAWSRMSEASWDFSWAAASSASIRQLKDSLGRCFWEQKLLEVNSCTCTIRYHIILAFNAFTFNYLIIYDCGV